MDWTRQDIECVAGGLWDVAIRTMLLHSKYYLDIVLFDVIVERHT
jgi:hypothetical protein